MQVRRHQQQFQRHRRADEVQDEPMNAEETSRKRSAEDAGHEADDAGRGGAQPNPGSMVDDSMPELRREAEALGADAVALAEAYSSTRRQRAGAFGLSAGVAMDLRLGLDLGQRADQVKAEKRLSDEKPHLLILTPPRTIPCVVLGDLVTAPSRSTALCLSIQQTHSSSLVRDILGIRVVGGLSGQRLALLNAVCILGARLLRASRSENPRAPSHLFPTRS